MLATIEKINTGYKAIFERYYPHSVEAVWEMLTDNDKLPLWFPELKVDELKKGGLILFDMQDGSFEEMTITDFAQHAVLEFEWGEDWVRFELSPDQNGCKLLLIETIHKLTEHTPKDLAGWHVCLGSIGKLLDGESIEGWKDSWEGWHEKYKQAVDDLN